MNHLKVKLFPNVDFIVTNMSAKAKGEVSQNCKFLDQKM